MPALQFFTVFGEALKQENDERMLNYLSLTDIASIAIADAKYYETIRTDFKNRLSFGQRRASSALDPTDPNTVSQVEALTALATRLS